MPTDRNPNLAFGEAERIDSVDPNSRLGRQLRLRGGPYLDEWLNNPDQQTHPIIAVPRRGEWPTMGLTVTPLTEPEVTVGEQAASFDEGTALRSFLDLALENKLTEQDSSVKGHYVDADDPGVAGLATMAHEVKHPKRGSSQEKYLHAEDVFFAIDGQDFVNMVHAINPDLEKRAGVKTRGEVLSKIWREEAYRAASEATKTYAKKKGERTYGLADETFLIDQLEAFDLRIGRWKRDLRKNEFKGYLKTMDEDSRIFLIGELNRIQAEVGEDIYKLELGEMDTTSFRSKMKKDANSD